MRTRIIATLGAFALVVAVAGSSFADGTASGEVLPDEEGSAAYIKNRDGSDVTAHGHGFDDFTRPGGGGGGHGGDDNVAVPEPATLALLGLGLAALGVARRRRRKE